MTLEQTLMNKKYQSGLTRLENCLSTSDLEKVCDCKKSDEFTAFRLDTEKVISWLTTKVKIFTNCYYLLNSLCMSMNLSLQK